MSIDTAYVPVPVIYKSRGLIARDVIDQAPESTFLQYLNILEREENSVSSRFGTQIINRDPVGVGTSNYWFTEPVTTITRLNYQSSAWRYAGLADGSLWRRAGNLQGAYTELTLPVTATGTQIILSGDTFGSIVDSCFETSQPYIFIADSSYSIKDMGTGNPQLWGIDPSPYTLNVNPYAPLLIMIDSFAEANTYTATGVTGWAWVAVDTIAVNSGQLVTDFSEFFGLGYSGSASTRYPTSGSLGSVTSPTAIATISNTPVTTYSSSIYGFASVPLSAVDTVTLNVTISGTVTFGVAVGFPSNIQTLPPTVVSFTVETSNLSLIQLRAIATSTSVNTIYCSGLIGLQYSVDGGTTWNPPLGDGTTIINQVTVTPPSAVYLINGAVQTVSTIDSVYAVVSTQGGVGSVAAGMIALLNTNVQATVPISQVTATTLVNGLYTELLVQTAAAHGLSTGNTLAIYASSNDIVDGFYEVATVVSSTSFTVPLQSATQIGAAGGYITYLTSSGSYSGIPAACVVNNLYSLPILQMSAWGFYEWVPPTTTSFPFSCWSGEVPTVSATGTIGKTVALDLSQNDQVTDDDLIVLTLAVSAPQNIAQIQLQFFVGEGVDNYYSAFISQAYYQGSLVGSEDAYEATQSQILADTLGLITSQTPGTIPAQLQPTNISTGAGSWQACYIPRGNFLPVGLAGTAGLDWSNISGWMLTVTTNANTTPSEGVSFSCNGLYLQWGYGPSSFGGIGYDWRQTYYNANTGTESSPCPEQQFNEDYGYLSSTSAPIFLRQAAQVVGQYSSDPQVTHVRNYRRGGTLSSNWFQVGQIPNITGAGQFIFKDVIADAYIEEAQPLILDNDPPVTSSLVNPIQTTLASATTLSSLSSIYSTFSPQNIAIVGAYTVVQNQLVVVGNPSNEELVAVTTGGVVSGGNTTFTAILRLEHNQGEPVNIYAVPRQACDLCAFAYNRVWLAGDPNNPHYLYYSKKGLPENFGPQNYIPVTTPDDPINAVINWRGVLIVGTLKSWFIIVGQGDVPYPQPTGSVHGIIAKNGWTEVEGACWYRAADGLREFTGADGVYKSLPIEWIYRGNPECIPPQADPTQANQDVMAYYNNQVLTSYISLNAGSPRFRMVWDTNYLRYRYDDVQATAMFWEKDINVLLVGKQIGTGQYAVVQDQVGDYDDGGWNTASPPALIQTPINVVIQHPYRDLGKPHDPKQWNGLETDCNTQNQVLTTTLLFDDGSISIPLATINTGTNRRKAELIVNEGDGQKAYRASILHTIQVTTAPILFQEDIHAAILAEVQASYDSYFIKMGTDQSKFIKQGWFDYNSPVAIDVSLYADGSSTAYYTFTLPAQPIRGVIRVRFGNLNSGTTAFTMRTWRIVMLTTSVTDPLQGFQLWDKPRIEFKIAESGHSYQVKELEV
jgi:hypothetical protein